MSLGVQERHAQAFQSLASSTRSSSQGIDDFPILMELVSYIYSFHGDNEGSSGIDELAAGTILCETFSDFLSDIPIDQFHEDAKPLSAKADDNLLVFTRACERIQVPRACIATSADFREHNYAKIELMLVMFVIRGMIYGLPAPSGDSLVEKLKEYNIDEKSYPEKTKDRNTCKRIIDVFRNHNNDKSISVKDSSSESSEDEMTTQELSLRKAKDEVQARPDAISDSSDSERSAVLRQSERLLGAQGAASMAGESKSDSDEEVDEVRENKQVDDNISQAETDSDAVDEVGMRKNPTVVANVPMDLPENNDPIPAPNSASSDSESSKTDDEEVDEKQPSETKEKISEPIPASASDDEEVDETKSNELKEKISEPIPASESDTDDKVDEKSNDPIATAESDSSPTTDGIPPLPLSLPEPKPEPASLPQSLPEPEPEIITHSNNPAGYNRNVTETPEERAERHRKNREAKEAAKRKKLEEDVFMPPSVANPAPLSEPKSSPLINISQPVQEIKWYIVALLVVLMLLCIAGFITCGIWLAKVK